MHTHVTSPSQLPAHNKPLVVLPPLPGKDLSLHNKHFLVGNISLSPNVTLWLITMIQLGRKFTPRHSHFLIWGNNLFSYVLHKSYQNKHKTVRPNDLCSFPALLVIISIFLTCLAAFKVTGNRERYADEDRAARFLCDPCHSSVFPRIPF